MKLIMSMSLKEPELPIGYHKTIVSFLKAALSNMNPSLFEEIYGENKTLQKQFSFDVKLDSPKFETDKIILQSNQIKTTLVTNNTILAVDLYNCLLSMKQRHPLNNHNYLVLDKVNIQNHSKIVSNEVLIQMHSPIVVRKHERSNKDYYYFFDEPEFKSQLNQCVRMQLENCSDLCDVDTNVELEPVCAKRVVIKTFDLKIPASIGSFKLRGDKAVISQLYQMGIGSRRSLGFGLFEVLSQ